MGDGGILVWVAILVGLGDTDWVIPDLVDEATTGLRSWLGRDERDAFEVEVHGGLSEGVAYDLLLVHSLHMVAAGPNNWVRCLPSHEKVHNNTLEKDQVEGPDIETVAVRRHNKAVAVRPVEGDRNRNRMETAVAQATCPLRPHRDVVVARLPKVMLLTWWQ